MKILVLGSSNSIGQTSYIGHLSRMPGISVINKSIGASSSTAGLYSALSSGHAGSDYAIIDYEINEEGSIKYGLKSDEDVVENIRSLVFLLRQQNITPILAIMPTTRGRDRPTKAERLHLQVCEEDGVHTFNIADLFRRAARKGAAWAPLMRDDFHMASGTTKIVADALHDALGTLHAAARTQEEWSGQVAASRVIQAAALMTPERRVLRSSGHRAAWHAILREGKRLALPVGGEERLIGVLVNSGSAGGKVAFRGASSEVVKQMVIYFGREKAGWFISVMVDMKQPLLGTPDGMVVELLPQTAVQTESTLHQQPVIEGRYGELEIESFVVSSRAPRPASCPITKRPAFPRDMLEAVDQDWVAEQLLLVSQAP